MDTGSGVSVQIRIDMSFREYFPLGSWDWARGYGTERAPDVPFLYCSHSHSDLPATRLFLPPDAKNASGPSRIRQARDRQEQRRRSCANRAVFAAITDEWLS